MPYNMDMNEEKKPKIRQLLPEGWRKFKILSGRESVSKSGNDMIVFEFEDVKTGYVEDIYCVAVKGKRWMLKEILNACGSEGGKDGIYNWDMPDVIDKEIAGHVSHEPNSYINRAGDQIDTTQHRIDQVKKVDEEIAWDE